MKKEIFVLVIVCLTIILPSLQADIDENFLKHIRSYYHDFEVQYDEKQDVYNLYYISQKEFISWVKSQDEYDYFDCVEIETIDDTVLVFHYIMNRDYCYQSLYDNRALPYLIRSCLVGGNHVFITYGKGYHIKEKSVEYTDNDCLDLMDFSFEEAMGKNCSSIYISFRIPYDLITTFNRVGIYNFDEIYHGEYNGIQVKLFWVYGW